MKSNRLDCFLFSYDGNKYRETKKHLQDDLITLMEYDIIAEPFCGLFGFSRVMYELHNDFKGEFWLNDINKELIDLLSELKNNPKDFIDKIEKKLDEYKDNLSITKDKNRPYCISLISKGMNNYSCSLDKARKKIINYKNKLKLYKSFFKKVKFFNLPCDEFLELVKKHKKKTKDEIFIYFDPPYFNSCNKSYQMITTNDDDDGYRDGTNIYVDIYKYFKDNVDCMLVINRIDFINYFFQPYFYKKYGGSYQNNTKKGNDIKYTKNQKQHMIYKK
jgi:site-specific DNA-adenine methylase